MFSLIILEYQWKKQKILSMIPIYLGRSEGRGWDVEEERFDAPIALPTFAYNSISDYCSSNSGSNHRSRRGGVRVNNRQ